MLDPFEIIQRASLTGFPLMLVMLACFLVGALCMRVAIELDARELWRLIVSKKPEQASSSSSKEDEHE